jgi:acetolactate synthase-1/2/3 large subunit
MANVAAMVETWGLAYKKSVCFIDVHVESITNRVPPIYSCLNKEGEDPLELNAKGVSFL